MGFDQATFLLPAGIANGDGDDRTEDKRERGREREIKRAARRNKFGCVNIKFAFNERTLKDTAFLPLMSRFFVRTSSREYVGQNFSVFLGVHITFRNGPRLQFIFRYSVVSKMIRTVSGDELKTIFA